MKIGIINHWMVNNYGAVLLAYALEKKLINMGYDVETINWLPDEVRHPWKLSQLRKTGISHYIMRLGYFLVFILPRENKFKSFRNMFHNGKEKFSDGTLCKIDEIYDKIIVGGDQLWNYKTNYLCIENFLPFIQKKEKKVCYAASLSQDEMRQDFASEFKKLVEDFFYVTTREKRSQEIIESICNIKAPHVTDSAFLLSSEEWNRLAIRPKETNYIFVYQVQSDIRLIDFANELAKDKQCDIIYCPFPLKKQIKCKRKPYLSIERWLGYMANADYIVTDAFHGIVFSLIFNRCFFSEISEYGKDTSSRLTNILDLYDCSDRLINGKSYEEALNAKPINWEKVNSIIDKECIDAEYHITNMLGKSKC